MRIKPNLGSTARMIYGVVGLALIVGTFAIGLEGWERWVLPIAGGGSIATGALGW